MILKIKLITGIIVLFLCSFFPLKSQNISTDTLELDEVTVTGSKVRTARSNIPYNIDVLQSMDITLVDESQALKGLSVHTPGLFVSERGITGFGVASGAAGQINLRGLGGNPTTQVLMLIDGHPQFMGLMGHHLPDAYTSSDIERVEVIKGPASVLYGSNALAGVINLITKKQDKQGFSAKLRSMYGSYNTRKIMGTAGWRNDFISVYTSVNHDATDGHRPFSEFEITNGYVKAGMTFNPHLKLYIDSRLTHFNSNDPGATGTEKGERIDINRGRTSLSFENDYQRLSGAFKLFYNYGVHDISDGWHSRDEMYGLTVYQGIKTFQGNLITAGFDMVQYGGKGNPISTVVHDEEGNIIPLDGKPQFIQSPYNNQWLETKSSGAYLTMQQIIMQKLTLNAGVRYEMSELFKNEWIPQGGIAYNHTNNTTLKFSVSEGYRAPSLRELYLFPPANDKLKPENILQYELSWQNHWLNRLLSTEIAIYHIRGDHHIVKVPPAPPPPPIYRNSANIKNNGLELEANLRLNDFKINMNYSYIDMKNPLPATPMHNLFTEIRYEYEKFNFALMGQYIKDIYNFDEKSLISIVEEQYFLLDFRTDYTYNEHLGVFLSLKNLLNTDYQINYGYPMPGTAVFGGIKIEI
jgi:iron complex outermembrane receptor protein